MARMESAIFLGGAAGPLVVTAILVHTGPVSWVAFAASVAFYSGCALLWAALPEPRRCQGGGTGGIAEPADPPTRGTFLGPLRLLRRRDVATPAALFVPLFFAIISPGVVSPLYTKLDFINMTSEEYAYTNTISYGSTWFSLVAILPALLSCGWPTRTGSAAVDCTRLSALWTVAILAGWACAARGKLAVYALCALSGPIYFTLPCMRFLLSSAVPDSQAGSALSIIANIETLVGIVGPLALDALYTAMVGVDPAGTWWVLGGVAFLCFLFACCGLSAPLGRGGGGGDSGGRGSAEVEPLLGGNGGLSVQ